MMSTLKRTFLLIAACLVALVGAEENRGIYAQVELISGTKQKAQFLGIENDTVSLGGYIKNEFTILKFPKAQFKSIVDEKGNDLLNASVGAEPPASAPAESAQTASTNAVDSTQVSATESSDDTPQDPLATDSSLTEPASHATAKDVPERIFVGYESTGIDTNKRNTLTAFTFEIMRELDNKFQLKGFQSAGNCGDRACIQEFWKKIGTKDIFFGKIQRASHPDSASIEITRVLYEDDLPTIFKEQITVSLDSLFQDAARDGALTNLTKKVAGYPVPAKRKRSYIFIDTDPESATISRPEKDAICKSPCTFAVTDTGKIEVNAYWNVDKHLWGAQTFVNPIPGDTVKVSLKLKRVIPEIKIVSNPVGVEIFPGQDEITRDSKSLGKTPKIITLTTPGMAHLRLRKEGYRDTLVNFYVAPVSELSLDITMEHLSDFDEIKKQAEWVHQRRMSFIGKVLMGSSIAPVLAGSLLLYLAQQNYDDADDIKSELSMPSSAKGENYQKKKKKNRDLVNTGDRNTIIGGTLIGTGIAVFGLGLVLTF